MLRRLPSLVLIALLLLVAPAADVAAEPRVPWADAVLERVLPSVVRVETGEGLGSGVAVEVDGRTLVLTAAHVVARVGRHGAVTVVLADGRRFAGRVLGRDFDLDVALIEPDPAALAAGLRPASFDPRLPAAGTVLLTVGNPLGMPFMAAPEVVATPEFPYAPTMAQVSCMLVDGASLPGNSGGAVFDDAGRVRGIVGLRIGLEPDAWGCVWSAPTVARAMADIARAGDDVARPRLGVLLEPIRGGPPRVTRVTPASPLRDRLRPGDRILAVDGENMDSDARLRHRIAFGPPPRRLTVLRGDGEYVSVIEIEIEALTPPTPTLGGLA